jgi:hypothetical protein
LNDITCLFTLVTSVLLLALPRRNAAIPLLLAAAYVGRGAVLEIGPANFTVLRILVAVGILRVLIKGERIANGINKIDLMLVLWAVWLIGCSAFHTSNQWIFRAGIVWSELGCYFLFRTFLEDWKDVHRVFRILGVILLPVAVLMLIEKASGTNYFSVLGGYSEVIQRDGHIRSSGPFAHPILAGTVGATCFPTALYLWRNYRKHALMGLFAAAGIVFAATSSGPVIMVLSILFGMAMWKVRTRLREIRWLVLISVIVLDIIMEDPIYFLMARIDITGSSQSWHRAQLIHSSIEHFQEWWLTGTDYTRHWMPTGIHANNMHTDITNHFLGNGIMGGAPLMLIFTLVLVAAFKAIKSALYENKNASREKRFLIWTLGAILFGHVTNFFGISLFDQSVTFFYLVLACIGAVQSANSIELR